LASFIAQPLIDSGRLVPLFESDHGDSAGAEAEPMEIYACVSERSALNAKVRAFIEFIEAAMQADRSARQQNAASPGITRPIHIA
jgi:DNA-binding transcriptional LysR family regulator